MNSTIQFNREQIMVPVKILVVDDEVELERLIKQRFRKQIKTKEMEFIFASNGIDALHQLQQDTQVDMVLTDINMPGMDGLTFMHCLPKINETLKAVVISAYGEMPQVRQAMNEGAFDFLTKPIDFQDLERTIKKTLAFVRQLKDKQLQAKRLQEMLFQAAFYDGLTGLPNRIWLCNHLNDIFEQQKQTPQQNTALLFIDLDGFKQINDRFGHQMGDVLLQGIAQRLKLCSCQGDLVARLGGDEFVIVLTDITNIESICAVADRVQTQLMQPFLLGDVSTVIGASIGIAWNCERYRHPEHLLQEADIAMYSAKAQGKGRYVLFDAIKHQLSDSTDPKIHGIVAP